MIVIDASAAIILLLRSEGWKRISARLAAPRGEAFAPELIDVEVVHALRGLRLGRVITEERAQAALDLWMSWPLRRYPHKPLLRRTWELRRNLTAYDGLYLALAERLDTVLLTHDSGLRSADPQRVELV